MERKRLTITIAALIFAAILWWLSDMLSLPEAEVVTGGPQAPDYYMQQMRVTVMDKQGKPKYTLQAKRMEHYPKEKTSRLEKPYLIQYRKNGGTVHTRADKAHLPDSGNEIIMTGNVHIVQKKDSGKQGGTMTTNKMRILLD